jgi:hypothetical protein
VNLARFWRSVRRGAPGRRPWHRVPARLAGDGGQHDRLAGTGGRDASVLPWVSSAARLRSTKTFWRGRSIMIVPPSPRPGGTHVGRRALAGRRGPGGAVLGARSHWGGRDRHGCRIAAGSIGGCGVRPIALGVVLVVGRHAPRISFLSSPLVSVPTSMRATNSSPSRSAKPEMRRAVLGLRRDCPCRTGHAPSSACRGSGCGPCSPTRDLWGCTGRSASRSCAWRTRTLQDDELAVEVHRAGAAARGVAAGPALAASSNPPGRIDSRTLASVPLGIRFEGFDLASSCSRSR